ncbi:hypothetical protein JCM10212_006979 [Sporobolomyces blumeae]
MALQARDEVHSDSDDGYVPRVPSPPFPPARPAGDVYSHLDPDDSDSPSDVELDPVDDEDHHDLSDIPDRVGDFALVRKISLKTTPRIRVAKWQSEKSGLTVYWADVPDLVASLATTVVTEVFDSSGVPHTAEHLTFTASEHYPWSNVLDSIANRLLTQGTNAATANDNTTYTVESASEEGMLEILPVYLDHILFPLITPESFVTEIYHVNGKGEEGGTVFSEMQGREGNPDDVMALAQQQSLYNFRNAYRYETGGMLPHLRNLTLEKIVDYHEKTYVPQNVHVVVLGRSIDPERLLETISRTTERDLAAAGLARGPRPHGWIRPLVESTTAEYEPVLERDKVEIVKYGDNDTSTGTVTITWIGPRCHDFVLSLALEVLGDYLVGSDTSVLRKHFVEVPDPACSDMSFDVAFRNPLILTLSLVSVAQDRLSDLDRWIKTTLKMICVNRSQFDMDRVKTLLRQRVIMMERMLEQTPSSYASEGILEDILYGTEDGSTLTKTFSDFKLLHKLTKWERDDWVDLLEDWLVERHSVTLIGTPSPELLKANADADARRLRKTREKYGPVGLASLQKKLEAAEDANHHPPPDSLVRRYAVPDVSRADWIEGDVARSNGVGRGRETCHGAAQDAVNRDGGVLPIFVQFDDYESNFVTVSLFLHGPPLPIVALYIDTLFSMPVENADGTVLGWQDVSRKLDALFSSCVAESLNEGILASLTALKEDYGQAVSWLARILYDSKFDVDRLKTLVRNKVQTLPALKEDGAGVASAAVSKMCYEKASFRHPVNMLEQIDYFPRVLDRLEKEPKAVVAELEALAASLLDPRAMRVSVRGSVVDLEGPSSTWLDCFEPIKPFPISDLGRVWRPRELLSKIGQKPSGEASVYRIDNSQSTYLEAQSRAPDWTHPDFAALEVATSVLSQTNGLLWQVTRTAGLCYGSSVSNLIEAGFVSLSIYRSPDVIAALAAIRKLITSIVAGAVEVSELDVEAAKSQLLYAQIEDQRTADDAAMASFTNVVILGRPQKWAQRYTAEVEHVTVADVVRVVDTWIAPLVDSKRSIIGASASTEKEKDVVVGLEKLGYQVVARHFS